MGEAVYLLRERRVCVAREKRLSLCWREECDLLNLCVCVSVWVHFCALQVKWEDSMTVSRVKHFQVFVFMLSSPSLTHPPALSHVLLFFGFVSSLSSPVSLSRHITLAFFLLHAISSYFCIFFLLPSLTLPASPPDNDREKECQSDGRRLPPWQDAGRTRSPFTR